MASYAPYKWEGDSQYFSHKRQTSPLSRPEISDVYSTIIRSLFYFIIEKALFYLS